METVTQKSARLEFTLRAQITSEQRQRLLMEMGARLNAEQNQTQLEKRRRQDAEFFAAMEAALAPAHKIEQFTIKLDRYETATVQALMDNERDTLAVRKEIDAMLLKAHTLEDGRRVFKSEDGVRVFDEHGAELKPADVAPESISDEKPRAEAYFERRTEERRLVEERKGLHDYQTKLDTARERVKDPTLTENELSALDKELGQSVPDRVRKLVGDRTGGQSIDAAIAPEAGDVPAAQDRLRLPVQPAFQPG
ncbi:hypothetical protein [Bosea sp. 124]|uniref:hypothetical protein n=1 Tax=Bosea sp. 124 TaxID=2135642 RepID=UPI000D46BE88|nr:hypothetical protein [Bosea sp. 124]PTM40513.1 hypothetical protein C8D03_2037 [Bosea sp. 124]